MSEMTQLEEPKPSQRESDWLMDFAEFYKNSTIKDVNADFNRLVDVVTTLRVLENIAMKQGHKVVFEAAELISFRNS